jgi:integrase
MARTVRNTKIDSRTSRAQLPARKNPYWLPLSPGFALGYYKGLKGGKWTARLFDEEGKKHFEVIGPSDDVLDPDNLLVFSFSQAQAKAREFFARRTRELAGEFAPDLGPYTVEKALEDYFNYREQRGSKGVSKDRSVAAVRILPLLGNLEVVRLTNRRLRDWHTNLAQTGKLARIGCREKIRVERALDTSDVEAVRARRATANRTLTVLKAALNYAYQDNRVHSDEAWRKVKPFPEVDAPVIRFLSDEESFRLVNACSGAFRKIVKAALVTGCRYGELIRLQVSDFISDAGGTITIRDSKSGKPRRVALADDGLALFREFVAGKVGKDRVFFRDDGLEWAASHQQRPLQIACKQGKIEPAVTFKILRHTYASKLAMRGVPMGVIAAQLGHADTRMTEKHYAHLSPNYVANTVRAALPATEMSSSSNIITFSAI